MEKQQLTFLCRALFVLVCNVCLNAMRAAWMRGGWKKAFILLYYVRISVALQTLIYFYFPCFCHLFYLHSRHVSMFSKFPFEGKKKLHLREAKIYLYCYCCIDFPIVIFLCLSSDKIVVYYHWNFFISISSAFLLLLVIEKVG